MVRLISKSFESRDSTCDIEFSKRHPTTLPDIASMSSEKTMLKHLNEKIGVLSHEITYLHELVKYQDSKLDRLTSLLEEVLDNRVVEPTEATRDGSLVQRSSIGHLVNPGAEKESDELESREIDQDLAPVEPEAMASASVAAAAVAAARNDGVSQVNGRALEEVNDVTSIEVDKHLLRAAARKETRKTIRPSINVVFLHNPESVQQIYDEFTKGIHGQPPLCELDERYGKHQWRGDSRSKELKRFQRRRNLCDTIHRGMQKYGKSVEEIIEYIESFRGNRLLTWVMNGNVPPDLKESGDAINLN